MPPRFHCPGLQCAAGQTIDLPPAAAHHALRVLRLAVGTQIVLFNGEGLAWLGEIDSAGKKATARILTAEASAREAPLAITLVQCLPAADKMDWIVQKAVELGVAAIQPVQARRSVVRLQGERAQKRQQHWQDVAAAACEQCGRNYLPSVLPLKDLSDYLAAQPKPDKTTSLRCILDPQNAQGLNELTRPEHDIVFLIGPEGGFDPVETEAARRAGFQPLRLGPRVLRTETAGLAVIAASLALWGDF